MSQPPFRPRPAHVLVVAALVAGVVRGLQLPMTSDAGYHLLRAGNELLTMSLGAYAGPPGGDHAPILGALATALGGLFTGGSGERALLVPGGLLLGASAALVAARLLRLAGPPAALLGAALLLAPPAVASSFTYRPDAALGGLLIVLALARQMDGRGGASVTGPASLATLASPWTWPAAIVLIAPNVRKPWGWLPPAAAITGVTVLSLLLPEGSRAEILRGLASDVTFRSDPLGQAEVFRRVWGFSLLALVPIVVPAFVRAARPPVIVGVAAIASLVFAMLGGSAFAFRAASAALLPMAAFLFAAAVARIPTRAESDNPPRPVLFALLLPILLLLIGAGQDSTERDAIRRPTAREAQIASFLRDDCEIDGSILSERAGALAALSGRIVQSLPANGDFPVHAPRFVVLSKGRLPGTSAEQLLFHGEEFLACYVPLEFRRGRALDIRDVVWVRVEDAATAPNEYPAALLAAWRAEDEGDDESALVHYQQAALFEPPIRGRAPEGLGMLHARHDRPEQAERYFEQARRDPFAVRARGYLLDLALARGGVLRADTLVAEAIRFNPHLAEMRGERARVFAAAGLQREALQEAETAVRLQPGNSRLLGNLGIFLWNAGRFSEAREVWHRAVRSDPLMLSYLGDFDRAVEDMPAPPPVPLFSDVEFAPFGWRDEAESEKP